MVFYYFLVFLFEINFLKFKIFEYLINWPVWKLFWFTSCSELSFRGKWFIFCQKITLHFSWFSLLLPRIGIDFSTKKMAGHFTVVPVTIIVLSSSNFVCSTSKEKIISTNKSKITNKIGVTCSKRANFRKLSVSTIHTFFLESPPSLPSFW